MTKLTIGSISYTNTWPISYFFDESKFGKDVEIINQVPSQLNKQMAAGLIDIGPISSFAYGENADKYLLLPDLSVSAYGNVGSISLFAKTDINDIKNKKIALVNTSATSVNLLKIIMQEFLGGNPSYIYSNPNLEAMMEEADAALLIGDDALIANMQNEKDQRFKLYDLGAEWQKFTNESMTFAVWAVRRERVEENPELLYHVYREFLASKKKGKEKLGEIIGASAAKCGGTYDFWLKYFNGLSNDFGQDQRKGLLQYYKYANKIGVLEEVPEIELVDFEKISLLSSIK